jgi:hypothetical protein
VEKAKEAAKKGDVVVIFASTNSGEGRDRGNLNLDENYN